MVLVVEDEPMIAEIYELVLERAGYTVRVARDGVEALELATKRRPDFVFLDIRMPRLDGIGVLRAFAGDPATRDIPTVVMSNYDDPGLMRQSVQLGAKAYLIKAATDPNQLAGLVERWLRPRL